MERMTEGGSSTETEQLNFNCYFSVVKVKGTLLPHKIPAAINYARALETLRVSPWRTARIAKANATASPHLAIKSTLIECSSY